MDLSSGADTLLIAFAGISGALGLFPFEFFKTTRGFDVDKIFIRDLDQAWYHRGMHNISSDIEGTVEHLAGIIRDHDYRKVVCLGNSMGAYAALVVDNLLNSDVVHAFAPQTFLDDANRARHHDNRWPTEISSIPRSVDKRYMDLSVLYAQIPNSVEVNIYFSRNERIDEVHARKLEGFEKVNLYPFEGGGHLLAQNLRSVRRQTIWHQWGRFLRDTFLPVAFPV